MAVVGFLVFVELCSGILQGSVPTVVPVIGADLHVSSGDLNWVTSLTLLVSGISVPLVSKLGDIYGHRRMMRLTMAVVALGSVVVATAGSFWLLLVGRALQGLFATWLPLEFAIVRDRLRGKTAGTAIGLLVGALTVGATVGSVGIGLLAQSVHTAHALLWFPAVAVLLCLPVVFFLVPESTTRSRSRVDWTGAALLSTGLGAGMVALAQASSWGWGSSGVIALSCAAVVLLVLFVVLELRSDDPLVDIRLITRRSMAPLYVLSFVLGFAIFGSGTANATFMATPRTLGFGFGYGTLGISLMSLPMALAALLAGTMASRVVSGLGARATTVGGFTLILAGYLTQALAHAAVWQFAIAGVLLGLGAGVVIGSIPALIMQGLPADQTGIGTGIYNTLKTLAGSVAGAAFAVVMNQNQLKIPGVHLSDEHGYVLVWSICAAVAVIGVAAAALVRTPAAADPSTAPGALPRAEGEPQPA
ncbi:MFS transporter [Streptomyces mangrovisoli]|nr:MFS transporter [Streptomyces mangrovisoli]